MSEQSDRSLTLRQRFLSALSRSIRQYVTYHGQTAREVEAALLDALCAAVSTVRKEDIHRVVLTWATEKRVTPWVVVRGEIIVDGEFVNTLHTLFQDMAPRWCEHIKASQDGTGEWRYWMSEMGPPVLHSWDQCPVAGCHAARPEGAP